ncbi:MAG: hypothetical protein ACYDA8_09510, partial [Deferrisomatales bacterium]
ARGAPVAAAPRTPEHAQLREEDLKGHFEPKTPEGGPPGAAAEEPEPAADLQLDRAVDILKSWKIFRRLEPEARRQGGKALDAP